MHPIRLLVLAAIACVELACSGSSAEGISEASTANEVARATVALGTAEDLGLTDTENALTTSSSRSTVLLAGTDGHDTITAMELRIEQGRPVLRDRVEIRERDHSVADVVAISTDSGGWVLSTSGCEDDCATSSRFFYVISGDHVRRLEPLVIDQPSQLRWLGQLDDRRIVGQVFTYRADDGTPDPRSRLVVVDLNDGEVTMHEANLLNRPGIDPGVPEPSQLVCVAAGRIDIIDVLTGGDLQLTRSKLDQGSVQSQPPRMIRPRVTGTPMWVECHDDDTTSVITEDHATATATVYAVHGDGTVEPGPSRQWTGEIRGHSHDRHSAIARYGEGLDFENARAAFEGGMSPDEHLAQLRGGDRVLIYADGRWLDLPAPRGRMTVSGDGRLGLLDHSRTLSAVVIDE